MLMTSTSTSLSLSPRPSQLRPTFMVIMETHAFAWPSGFDAMPTTMAVTVPPTV